MLAIAIAVPTLGLLSFSIGVFEYLSFGELGVGPLVDVNSYLLGALIVATVTGQLAVIYLSRVTVQR
jgi:hypothetical protein